MNVHKNFIYNSPKLETSQMTTNKKMGTYNVHIIEYIFLNKLPFNTIWIDLKIIS
jgi:hypothetical protein